MHRYSTDREWLVPHFEKMLYDQALGAVAYLEAYQITGKEFYARTAREILAYVDRDMKSVTGGFYSAEDADSEGVEGKFYVWTNAEIREVLGEEDGDFYIETFHLTEEGNFLEEATQVRTGANIPHLKEELLDEARERVEGLRVKLYEAREKRVHPFKDDKILTDWNGLMISAYAKAAKILGDEAYAATAAKAADFVLTELRDEDGRLLKRYRQGESGLTAPIEDYAFMICGLLDLYETNFEVRHLAEAIALQAIVDEFFRDTEKGGYFTVAEDAEQLIVRAKKLYGGAIPSGNAVSISNLSRLYRTDGQPRLREAERRAHPSRFPARSGSSQSVYPVALCGLDFTFGPAHEIVISGEKDGRGHPRDDSRAAETSSARTQVIPPPHARKRRRPSPKLAPYTETQLSLNGKATAYVCRQFACKVPTNKIETMLESIGE